MGQHKYALTVGCLVFMAQIITACVNPQKQDLPPTSIVEPGAVPTSAGPLEMDSDLLLVQTKAAVEQGNRDFWLQAGQSFIPGLPPEYTSVDEFVDQMDLYSQVFDLQCQLVLRYPWNDGYVGEVVSIVFSASGNEDYESSEVLVPEIGVFEVAYLVDDGNTSIFNLVRSSFISSTGETPDEKYQNLISFREGRMELNKFPCPELE